MWGKYNSKHAKRDQKRKGLHRKPSPLPSVATTCSYTAISTGTIIAAVALPGTSTAAASETVSIRIIHPLPEAYVKKVEAVSVRHAELRTWRVQTGNTLSAIAQQEFDNAACWPGIYRHNRHHISNPDLIYTGQEFSIPAGCDTQIPDLPFHVEREVTPRSGQAIEAPAAPASGAFVAHAGGLLSCSDLESLWMSAGGSPATAFTMAEIAKAESGGNQYATGSAGEEGYWQILPANGDATYDPMGNAEAAVHIEGTQGLDAWTTWTGGLYQGKC